MTVRRNRRILNIRGNRRKLNRRRFGGYYCKFVLLDLDVVRRNKDELILMSGFHFVWVSVILRHQFVGRRCIHKPRVVGAAESLWHAIAGAMRVLTDDNCIRCC